MHTNTILAGIAAALAIPTAYTLIQEQSTFTDYTAIPRLFEGFTPDNIQFVVLSKGSPSKDGPSKDNEQADDGGATSTLGQAGEPQAAQEPAKRLVFVRQDDQWVLGATPGAQQPLQGAPVLSYRIENDILKHMRSIRRDESSLIAAGASEAEMQARGLTADEAILIQCLNAEQMPMAELYRGDDASGGEYGEDTVRGWFVARKGHNDIILYEPPQSSWLLSLNAEDWVDNKIHQFTIDQTAAFSLHNPHGKVRFTRGSDEPAAKGAEGDEAAAGAPASKDWIADRVPEGKGAVRQQEVNNLLSRFNYISCTRYLGRAGSPEWRDKVPGPDDCEVEVIAELTDGTRRVMWIGAQIPNKNEYYARFEGEDGVSPFLVAVGEWVRSPFVDQEIDDLFDPSAELVGPEQSPETAGERSGTGAMEGESGQAGEAEDPAQAAKPPSERPEMGEQTTPPATTGASTEKTPAPGSSSEGSPP